MCADASGSAERNDQPESAVWRGDGNRRLAKSLITLIDQVDAKHPRRDKSSDGSIGDAAHQATQSDHNPNAAGVVTALDLDRDIAAGFSARNLAEALVASRDPRIKYIISNGQIISSKVSPWQWRPYTGANAHREHIHVSVDADPALYDDARPWAIGGATQQPARTSMRFTGITATVFGGPSDLMSGTQTAYGALVAPNWWERPGVALPARINARPLPKVTVMNPATGRSVVCDVIDVGPWNIRDAYWETGTRPRAEGGGLDDYNRTPTNKAGIDLTPAAAAAIGLNGKGLVDWDFVGAAAVDGEVLPPLKPAAPADPMASLLPILLLLLMKENPLANEQPTTGQGKPDLLALLLPVILQAVISGKPLNANDLLLPLLQSLTGAPLALPAPAAPAPEPAQPAVPQTSNDVLVALLAQIAKGGGSVQPVKPVEPAPPAATVPAPGTTTAPADRGIAATGFLGIALSVLGQLTGVMPVVGEAATAVGPTVAASSALALAGGALGAISPTLGLIARIAGGVLQAVRTQK